MRWWLFVALAGCHFSVPANRNAPHNLAGDAATPDSAADLGSATDDLSPALDLAMGSDLAPANDLAGQDDPVTISSLVVTTDVNLTTEAGATGDWMHWGQFSDRRASGGSLIGDRTVVGGGTEMIFTDSPIAFSWTDGTPTQVATVHTGLRVYGKGKGFQITAPADKQTRRLFVWVRSNGADLDTQAQFAGVHRVYDDVRPGTTSDQWLLYTITYATKTAATKLIVTFTDARDLGGPGFVGLCDAALN
jgi:hypothetical protein